jgi:hypothetical protein
MTITCPSVATHLTAMTIFSQILGVRSSGVNGVSFEVSISDQFQTEIIKGIFL